MINYDKTKIKEALELEDIFQLLVDFGGEPEYTNFGIISATICHNLPGEGSRKLYMYTNSGLFHCYTGCEEPSFDIFELVRKIAKIQWHEDFDLNDAVRWIARRFGIAGSLEDDSEFEKIEDWKLLANYDRIQEIELNKNQNIILKEYDTHILDKFNYKVAIEPWLREGISRDALDLADIGFYPGGNQITIPHFDKDGRFIGLRGRTLSAEDAERYGKYRPIKINGQLYTHPLGLNLYGLNWAKNSIKILQKAIVVEGEKSVLKYMSYFGIENNICVASCGSNLSHYQIQLLQEAGAKEIVVAFDRDFEKMGDDNFKHLVRNCKRLNKKYNTSVNMSFIIDKNLITGLKNSPIDDGIDKFLQLFKERVIV